MTLEFIDDEGGISNLFYRAFVTGEIDPEGLKTGEKIDNEWVKLNEQFVYFISDKYPPCDAHYGEKIYVYTISDLCDDAKLFLLGVKARLDACVRVYEGVDDAFLRWDDYYRILSAIGANVSTLENIRAEGAEMAI